MPISPPIRLRDAGGRLRPGRIALLAAGAFLSALLIAETAARLLLPGASLGWIFQRGPYYRVRVMFPPEGIAGPSRLSTNIRGMRGDDPPAPWRRRESWLAFGSSTTLCEYVDDDRTWPHLLQQALRRKNPGAWIGNAGEDGLTTRSLIVMMERIIPAVRPGGVLILPGPADMVLAFSDSRRERGSPFDHAFGKRVATVSHPAAFRERSALVHAWRLWKRRRSAGNSVLDNSPHPDWSPPVLKAPEDSPPRTETLAPLAAYRENLKRIMAIAGEAGVRAVFLTQPIAYRDDSAWATRETRTLRIHGRDYRISAATERRLLDVYNAALLALCRAESAECFDLAGAFPADTSLFYDGGHFNDAGSALAAELIALHLRDHPGKP